MRIGMVGLGRMGGNMARRLMRGGHSCVVFDRDPEAVEALAGEGASGAASLAVLVSELPRPRVVWMMVPAAVVDDVVEELMPLLRSGDVVVDGGNTHYREDIRRAGKLAAEGIHYVDVGTSGGVLGLEHGFCLMIGGEPGIVAALDPVFTTLAPAGGIRDATAEPGGSAASSAPSGYLHCGPHGAGHFVKMVHNGIEYGLMAAYAEGFNVLRHADAGLEGRHADAETAPLSDPALFQYRFDVAAIAELWRHGSIVSSRLLDLTAAALAADPGLDRFSGRVSDSGEGRWTLQAAIEEGVPAFVLSAALHSRFASRGRAEFADKLLSAMRLGFGGHAEKQQG
jgi:6-phosphogluconate dehydrogenase